MSDNEDLLGDDLGDQSLADYNLGNEEEEQLLADDYDSASSQNVPPSVGLGFGPDLGREYPRLNEYCQDETYPASSEECVVPNLSVEPPPTYAPYEPTPYSRPREQVAIVPPPILAAPPESPQIVPSEVNPSLLENVPGAGFLGERPLRTPRVRDIPDSLDKVLVPRSNFGQRGSRTAWRNPNYNHPYKRHNMHRGNFLQQRPMFPPPQMRLEPGPLQPPRLEPPQIPLEPPLRPQEPPLRPPEPALRPEILPDPQIRMKLPIGPNLLPERQVIIQEPIPQGPIYRPMDNRSMQRPDFKPPNQFAPRFPPNSNFRPNMDDRPNFGPRPNFERPPFHYQPRPNFSPRQFPPQIREIAPNNVTQLPQVTIRQQVPRYPQKLGMGAEFNMDQEVRMLPLPMPSNVPAGMPGKKVLINPHFKGNFQAPVEGIVTYIPTRIQKSPPPLSPTIENKFGPVKDIDEAAERFIAEQRSALARAAARQARRSPQRYVDPPPNTEAERSEQDDLLRRQEQFINANRAGLRRRMRTPSPVNRRSLSPRRSPEHRRQRERSPPRHDEDSEYRRRVREQETLRERVLRAKEVRRRKNAVALQKQLQDRERDRLQDRDIRDDDRSPERYNERDNQPRPKEIERAKTPEKQIERSPEKDTKETKPKEDTQILTPPRETMPVVVKEKSPEKETVFEKKPVKETSPERAMTPPLPIPETIQRRRESKTDNKVDYDNDDLELILDDFENILSDDEDSGRFKEKPKKVETPKVKPAADLRTKLQPKTAGSQTKRQKIVFHDAKEEKKKKERSPPKRGVVTSSTKHNTNASDTNNTKTKNKSDQDLNSKRQRIIFDNTNLQPTKEEEKKSQSFPSRRVVLQRKVINKEKNIFSRIEQQDPTKPNPGIFSRAIRNTISESVPVKKHEDPQVYYEDSDAEENVDTHIKEDIRDTKVAIVTNLPHGMTDMRMKTLAGHNVQSINLDKAERSAKITFTNTSAAQSFKKKFNNKMVAASRLSVTLQN